MTFPVTENLKQGLNASEITPNLVMKLDGYTKIFGGVSIKKYIKIGDPGLLIGGGWTIGGFSLLENQAPYITFNTGTTTQIGQKLDISRGQGSSVSQMVVSLVDKNEEISKLISPGFELADILGRAATIYIGISNSAWPEDYVTVFRGLIQSVESGAGFINLLLSNTEEKKRATVTARATSELANSFHYRSILRNGVLYQNQADITGLVSFVFNGGGTAGSEVVTVLGNTITVTIEAGVTTGRNIRSAIEGSIAARVLATVKVNDDLPQPTGSFSLGTDTSLTLDDASEFLEPADGSTFKTFVKIADELVEYTGKSGNTLTGVTRGADGTPAYHAPAVDAEQWFKLTGNGLDLALKLMLSTGPEYYAEDLDVRSIEQYTGSISIPNAIFFQSVFVGDEYGVTEGDTIEIYGSGIGGNNITTTVAEVGVIGSDSYIVTNDTLIAEANSPAQVRLKSRFNTLPIGLGMLPKEVDITEHEYIRSTFLPLYTLEPYFTEILNGKDFIEKELYLPMACFSIPRKGRSSVSYHVAPLIRDTIKTLDASNVENAEKLRLGRSTSENFFNEVVYDLDYSPVEGEFKTVLSYPSTVNPPGDLSARVPVSRAFKISAKGLRLAEDAQVKTSLAAQRFLDRYELGAEFIKGVKLNFRTGYQTEIGDFFAVDFSSLKITDYKTGTRDGDLRLMGVLNKILDNKTGQVTVDLVNTAFELSQRFGLISPASIVAAGSTTTKIKLKKSYSTKSFERESTKWRDYIGQEIRVVSPDFSTQYTTFIRGFDNLDPQGMLVDAIGGAPSEGWFIRAPNYPASVDPNILAFWKQKHAHFNPQIPVAVSLASQTQFEVSGPNAARFAEGQTVRVHSYDYSDDSGDVEVQSVSGVTITLVSAVGFVINTTHKIDLIGFPDGGEPYRII